MAERLRFFNWLEQQNQLSVWLDDERKMPPEFNIHVKTASEAIELLKTGRVAKISLDHDLGNPENGTGAQVARWIEEQAYHGTLPQLAWTVHSANPVGRANMTAALTNADKFWSR